MDKEYCRDCALLVAGPNDEWLCGSHHDDEISTFDECPESEPVTRCPECGQEFNNSGWGHEVDAIKEFGKCSDCFGYCPICKKEMEKLPEQVEKISHGFMVQKVNTRTDKVTEQDFHIIESVWEDDDGNHIDVPYCLSEKWMPIIIKEQEDDDTEPVDYGACVSKTYEDVQATLQYLISNCDDIDDLAAMAELLTGADLTWDHEKEEFVIKPGPDYGGAFD